MHVAAMKMIGDGGTHNLTLKEVSKRAGFSRSMASARFGTKEALFSELISVAKQRWLNDLSKSIAGLSGTRALRAWSDGLASLLETNGAEIKSLYILCYETIGSSEQCRKLVEDTHMIHRSRLQRWIAEGIAEGSIRSDVSAEDMALHYVSLYYGLVYQWLVEPTIDIVGALRRFTYDFGIVVLK